MVASSESALSRSYATPASVLPKSWRLSFDIDFAALPLPKSSRFLLQFGMLSIVCCKFSGGRMLSVLCCTLYAILLCAALSPPNVVSLRHAVTLLPLRGTGPADASPPHSCHAAAQRSSGLPHATCTALAPHRKCNLAPESHGVLRVLE